MKLENELNLLDWTSTTRWIYFGRFV